MTHAPNLSPCFTIGIPVFNGQDTLKETLESCAKVPAEAVRVIVIDNCSTDATYEIAQDHASSYPHMTVFRHEQNVGAANNFKYLLDTCQTEYFMWLAADDVIESMDLTEVERLFELYPRAIAVAPFAMVGYPLVPDRGNRPLVCSASRNVLKFLLRPGVNSRFYSIYRTERLRKIFASTFGTGNGGYFASDIVFSVAVLREGEWPLAESCVLTRKPGISADGWKLRKSFAKSLLGAVFPSKKFIHQIVGMVSVAEKIPVLLVVSLLYLRYFIGPVRHRLSLRSKD